MEHGPEAVQEKPGAGEQDGGKGGFGGDEKGAGARPDGARGGVSGIGWSDERLAADAPGREQAEEESARDGERGGKREDHGVDGDFAEPRSACGEQVFQPGEFSEGERGAEQSAGGGEQDGLGEQLAREAAGAGAERGAERDFLASRGGLGDQ